MEQRKENMKIGSHVSLSGSKMFLGSVEEALSYNANALMIYTGAPQNTRRKPIEEYKKDEALELLKENDIPTDNVIVHAPYIINLANTTKEETFEIAVNFLKQEIKRVQELGLKYIVLHPGSHVGAGEEVGLDRIVEGLNIVLNEKDDIIICLETMSGKGSELGYKFEQLKYIIDNVNLSEKLGVCLDTCHIHDAGYDLNSFDEVLNDFENIIGLERLNVIHVNDSKNERGAKKDRHENLGYGYIGFDNLLKVLYHPKLENIVKVLETPYTNDRKTPPYKKEIEMIRNKKFEDWITT